jgi:hypothetical protein
MTSKMKTAARPISINVRIRSERTIKADLSQPRRACAITIASTTAQNFKTGTTEWSTSFANYNPASG